MFKRRAGFGLQINNVRLLVISNHTNKELGNKAIICKFKTILYALLSGLEMCGILVIPSEIP